MYHERREDGEKVRFAVKKRPEEGEQKDSAPKNGAAESKSDSQDKAEKKRS